MKAAVFHGPHQPLTIENVDIDKPIGREVLVRTVASGVCHSDLHFVDGFYPFPTPAILGHEAAGIVEAVGLQVSEFKPGDHVIACLSVFCGHCDYCLTGKTHLCQTRPVRAKTDPPKLSWKGQPVNQFANLSAYAEQMLVHENALVKIDDSMPLDRNAKPTPSTPSSLELARVIPAAIRTREPVVPLAPPRNPEPTPGIHKPESGTVVIDVEQGGILVPSFLGKHLRAAVELAEQSNLELEAVGSGVARDQSPPAGAHVAAGAKITVHFER